MAEGPPFTLTLTQPVPMKTQPEDAVVEMVLVLTRDFKVRFAPDGLHQFVQKISGSAGAYLRKYGVLNPDIDLWNDPGYQDIRSFVMDFAVPEFGKAFNSSASESSLGIDVVRDVMTGVMTRKDTEVRCGRATVSFAAKLPTHAEVTPVCNANARG